MKLTTLLTLIILVAGLLSPVSFMIDVTTDAQTAVIFTLDVCSASSYSLSVNGEMPAVNECSYMIMQPTFIDFYISSDYSLKSLLVVFQKEYPPEV